MTPSSRMSARQTAGRESVHKEMGNGSLFTVGSGKPTRGSFCYNHLGHSIDISEGVADGGLQTQDRTLAAAARNLGIFNEVKL